MNTEEFWRAVGDRLFILNKKKSWNKCEDEEKVAMFWKEVNQRITLLLKKLDAETSLRKKTSLMDYV